jgi:hypothetical protein
MKNLIKISIRGCHTAAFCGTMVLLQMNRLYVHLCFGIIALERSSL